MKKTNLENWICETEALPELTREGLETLQLKRLNQMLSRLAQQSRFYTNLPTKLNSLQELQTLPFTTPQMLAEQSGKFLLTSQSEVSRVISAATSGTTGPAKRVFYTDTDTEHTVGFFAAGISEMLRKGEKCLIAFPFTGPFGLGDLIAKAVERLGGIPIKAGFGQPWQEMFALLEETKPETYIGFPVTLLSLVRLYGENFPVKRALVSADACPKGVMTELEKMLGSKLYPHYGSRECGLGGAVTCPAHKGMHLRENHIIAEIVDEQGNMLPDGEYGELVITTIGADAMPLLRYKTGDYTRILPPCPCGGVTKRLDIVSRRDGSICIEDLDSTLFAIPELIDYQVTFDGILQIKTRCLENTDIISQIYNLAKNVYPQLEIRVSAEIADKKHRPMYFGKRCVLYSI